MLFNFKLFTEASLLPARVFHGNPPAGGLLTCVACYKKIKPIINLYQKSFCLQLPIYHLFYEKTITLNN